MAWTYARIKAKTRNLTGRRDSNAFTDDTLGTYVNDYLVTLPAVLNLPELRSWYEFNTTLNTETYALSADDYIIGNPLYIDGAQSLYYNNPEQFYKDYRQSYSQESIGTGDGSTVTFAYTLTSTPIKPGTVVIDDETETFTASAGVLTGDAGGSGTVNNTTGAVSVTFNTAPSSGQDLKVRYEYYNTSVPQAVLYYNDTLHVRPVPNGVYHIKIANTTLPTALSAESDTLTEDMWGQLVAYGAALDILRDYEGEGALITQRVQAGYENKLLLINRRQVLQMKDKVVTRSF